MVTAPGEQAGPTPQMVPVPETADPAVVKESDTLEPAGLRLNCHSQRPSRLLPGERREWLQPTVVRSTSEARCETRIRTSALDSVGSYRYRARQNRVRRYREGPPNGSRLSCGRNVRRRKTVQRQKKRLVGEATQFLRTCERPGTFKRLLDGPSQGEAISDRR